MWAPDIPTAVKYAKHAARNGADALISLPHAGAPALIEYYKAVGAATGLPLFAQAVGDFSVDHLIEIYRAVPTLRYIKDEAGQRLRRFPILKEKSGGELNVFSGGGKTLLDEMIRGFSGCMPFAGFADLHAAVWDLWHEGNEREAMDLFGKAAILMEAIATYGLEVVKYILCRRGVFKNCRTRGGTPRMRLDDRSQQVGARSWISCARISAPETLPGPFRHALPAHCRAQRDATPEDPEHPAPWPAHSSALAFISA